MSNEDYPEEDFEVSLTKAIKPIHRDYPTLLVWYNRTVKENGSDGNLLSDLVRQPEYLNKLRKTIETLVSNKESGLAYKLAQILVHKAELSIDDPVYGEIQRYLRYHGIDTVIFPNVFEEGHA